MKPIIAALLFYFLAIETAYGCRCRLVPPLEKYEKSSVVFIGRVVALREQGEERYYEFQVDEILKGGPTGKLIVSSSGPGSACGSFFPKGINYLIYADGATDQLTTYICKGNSEEGSSRGRAEIEALRGRK